MKGNICRIVFAMVAVIIFNCARAAALDVKIYVQPDAEKSTLHGAAVLKQSLEALEFNPSIIKGMSYTGTGAEIVIADISIGEDANRLAAELELNVPAVAESYVVTGEEDFLVGIGSDAVGAMYAAYDIAEQIESAMTAGRSLEGLQTRTRTPFMEIRAVNPFFHVEAFQDDDSWYYDEDFWISYLDELSRDRYNLLDIHAMYGLYSTFFPNCYLYLLKSDKFPEVGVPRERARLNLVMFNKIIELAAERGIRVSLMSYHASWHLTAADRRDDDAYVPTDDELAEYTRDVVSQIIRKCPGLWMIGFRIGESGRNEDFFEKSYIAGIRDSGRDIMMFTRTWLAQPWQVMQIADAYPGRTFLEIKYNGEQLGLPYHSMTVNRRSDAPSYTYENYTDWPRNYKIIWQIRSNGTHRLFRWGDPVFAERTMRSVHFGSGAGFTMEPMTAYYPMTDYYFKPELGFDFFTWDHQRNWFWYMLWGRLAYNPDAGEEVWLNRFRKHFGAAAARDVYETVANMSRIVPLVYSWRCLGPDHRHMAPEYETGGSLDDFSENYALDPDNIYSIEEYVNHFLFKDPLLGVKLTPFEAADMLDEYAIAAEAAAARAAGLVEPGNTEFQSLQAELAMLVNLARYYSNKIRAATHFEFFKQKYTYPEYRWAQEYTATAHHYWGQLSENGDRYFRPILDTLRMRKHTGKPTFTWSELEPSLEEDNRILDAAAQAVQEKVYDPGRFVIYHLPAYVAPEDEPLKVTATIYTAGAEASVHLRYRKKGADDFSVVEMLPGENSPTFIAEIPAADTTGQVEYFITAVQGGDRARYPSKESFVDLEPKDYKIEDYAFGYAKIAERERRKRIDFEKQRYVTVDFDAENEPPDISVVSVNVLDEGKRVEITARVEDDSPIRKIRLYYKPMPTNFFWETTDMEPAGDGLFRKTLELTPSGLLYYFHAADSEYNAAAYPDFLEETPCLVLDSWDPAVNPYAD